MLQQSALCRDYLWMVGATVPDSILQNVTSEPKTDIVNVAFIQAAHFDCVPQGFLVLFTK
jgi:hypothetical protein